MHHEWLVMDVSNKPDATKARLALVMSAKMADKPLMTHVKDTCASVTNWTGDQILHVRLK
jgi:hypothetical protein